MTWYVMTAAVILGWVVLSVAVAVGSGQAIRIADRRTPRRPAPNRRRVTRFDRVVEIATDAIPMIRPRELEAVTGAIPLILRRID